MLKVMSREGHLRETFCKWSFSAEAGQFSLEFLPEATSTLSGPLPLLLAKVITTLEPTLPCTSSPGPFRWPLGVPLNPPVFGHMSRGGSSPRL